MGLFIGGSLLTICELFDLVCLNATTNSESDKDESEVSGTVPPHQFVLKPMTRCPQQSFKNSDSDFSVLNDDKILAYFD